MVGDSLSLRMESFRDLKVWQKAVDLSVAIYRATERYPDQELYGLTSQMRRAAVAIPSNIAEGKARSGRADYSRFLAIARGSLAELETQIVISTKLGYLESNEVDALLESCAEVGKMLSGLRRALGSTEEVAGTTPST